MAVEGEKIDRKLDVSGGERHRVSRFQHKLNQLEVARNVDLSKYIGSATRRDGNERIGNYITADQPVESLLSYYKEDGYDLLGAANDSTVANTKVAYLNYDYNWTNIITDFPAYTRVQGISFLGLEFIGGYSDALGQYATTTVIKKDRTYTRSVDVVGAPRAKSFAKFSDQIYAANIELAGKRYSDRIARSSLPTDRITFVNGAINAYTWSIFVDDAKYLRVGMKIDIYRQDTKVADSIEITQINYTTNRVHFQPRNVALEDNDEVYLEDQKGTFHVYWNDDDYLLITPVANELPDVTHVEEGNNRLLIWTTNSFRKWDNANLIPISETVGCPCPDTIKKLSNGWFMWVDQLRNVWAYNDKTGQFQNVSRGMEPRLLSSKRSVLEWNATALDDLYTLYIGECNSLEDRGTSTSTSSTSTSSTSTSTSSTSTSSTSTSTTTVAPTPTTTSTSSTSTSTSSTSTSTSSTSSSTSTTVGSRRTTYRLRYRFDMNAWTHDTLDRDVTASTVYTHSNGKREIYWGDETGRVYRQEVGLTDYGLAIPFDIQTFFYDQGSPELIKEYNEIFVYTDKGQSALIYLKFLRPNKANEIEMGETEWIAVQQLNDGTNRIKPRDSQYRGEKFYGYAYKVRVTQYDTGDSVVYEGTSCIYTTRRQP